MSQALQNQSVLESLELQTTWSAKVGPEYNKIESTKYWTTLRSNGIREYGHEAPAGGGWLSGLNDLSIPSNWTKGVCKHRLLLAFDMSVVDWASGSRIVELDNRISDGKGNNFNFSNQFNLSENWMWQVDPQTGVWTDTGIRIPPLAPLVWHDVEFENHVDFVGLRASFQAVKIDGTRYAAPTKFSNLIPVRANWGRGSNLQVQMCRQSAGIAMMWARGIRLTWIPD